MAAGYGAWRCAGIVVGVVAGLALGAVPAAAHGGKLKYTGPASARIRMISCVA